MFVERKYNWEYEYLSNAEKQFAKRMAKRLKGYDKYDVAASMTGFSDGFFTNDKAHQIEIIKILRKYQPDIVLANAPKDRHPDHGRASQLVSEACFYSWLVKIETELNGENQELWRPKAVYYYIQDRFLKPDFVVDVSDFVDTKMESIMAFSSQFYNPDSEAPETPISGIAFLDFIKSRMANFGRDIAVEYAEGYTVERVIGVEDITLLK